MKPTFYQCPDCKLYYDDEGRDRGDAQSREDIAFAYGTDGWEQMPEKPCGCNKPTVHIVTRRESDGPVSVHTAAFATRALAEQTVDAHLPEWPGFTAADYEITALTVEGEPVVVTPTYDQLLAFVTEVASQLKDGDAVYKCGKCGLTSNAPFEVCPQCSMPDQCYADEHEADGNDDEVDAFYGLISDARDLLGTDGSDLPIPVKPTPVPEGAPGHQSYCDAVRQAEASCDCDGFGEYVART